MSNDIVHNIDDCNYNMSTDFKLLKLRGFKIAFLNSESLSKKRITI